MASPAIGAKSYMQFGREAVWGTAVAATKRLGIIRHSVKTEMVQVKDPTLTGDFIQRGIFNVLERAVGQIEMFMTYTELLMFLDAVMGAGTFGSNGGTTTGAGPFTHVFVEREFYNSFTIELIEGNIPANKCQRVLGAKIKQLTIKGDGGDICRVILDIVGKQKQLTQTPTVGLSAAAPLLALAYHATAFVDGSGDTGLNMVVKSFEFSILNGMDDMRKNAGTQYIDEPIRNDVSRATMKFKKEFRTVNVPTLYISGASVAPTLQLANGLGQTFTFQIDAGVITSYDQPTDGFGIQFQDVTVESILSSGSPNYGAKMTAVNSQATINT